MLHELKATQPEQDRVRRWFADDYFDLIVWMEKDGDLAHGDLLAGLL